MRTRDQPGDEFVDGRGRYRVVRVELAPNPQAFRHIWAELMAERAALPT